MLDKHIAFASLHSPLPTVLRRDIAPFVVALAALVAQAAPALLYEMQVAWIQSGDIEPDETATAAAATTAAAPSSDSAGWELSDDLVGANATTAVLSAVQQEIAALAVPESAHFYAMYLLPVFAVSYAIFWLALYWNVKLQVAMRFSTESGGIDRIRNASHIRVQPVEHGGKSEICEIQRVPATGDAKAEEMFFVFQKVKYVYQKAAASALASASSSVPLASAWFAPLDLPVSLELSRYISSANDASERSVERVEELGQKYGENAFDIPLPPFMDLFKEHALAPFFVFQIFCVLLWCLDEYWVRNSHYYRHTENRARRMHTLCLDHFAHCFVVDAASRVLLVFRVTLR